MKNQQIDKIFMKEALQEAKKAYKEEEAYQEEEANEEPYEEEE